MARNVYSQNTAIRQKSKSQTPQTQPILGKEHLMSSNNAGGVTFILDKWVQLDRLLILGADGGTFYVSERKLVLDNFKNAIKCIQEDGIRVVDRVVEISDSGRSAKNTPALFVMALCMSPEFANVEVRKYAANQLPKVARIGTHILQFAEMIQAHRGWGKIATRAIKNWFDSKDNDALALQVIKYYQREGWSLRDLLRLSHIKTEDESRKAIMQYITHPEDMKDGCLINIAPRCKPELSSTGFGYSNVVDRNVKFVQQHKTIIAAVEAKTASVDRLIELIITYNLPREAVPTEMLNNIEVWGALLEKMPMTAMIRNLNKMTSLGVLAPLSDGTKKVVSVLSNGEAISKSRIHPMQILIALKQYSQGHGFKGSLTWRPVSQIIDALDNAFYLAFKNVEPTGKNYYLGIDVSGSMASKISHESVITCAEGAAALAMVTMRTEPWHYAAGFSSANSRGYYSRNNTFMKDLKITAAMNLNRVLSLTRDNNFGGTDCSLPMLDAIDKKMPVDCFIVLTDNETWAGNIQPVEALKKYRQVSGRNAKLVVVGMSANPFSIADPTDPGMLDVVGFDANTPAAIAEFMRM